ncbi:uncharacterized protein LOC115886977 [Sitophilus oryzae]|uniref:Uncharacterized protein LOC115886977 n=1 Tax=Sitophilus oryzae TaxID=7048 RepID=A0A6J2YGC0_SITOR|nr:uncharacterized protein LOC115886977 [Sitophilus oryzae]
MIPLSKELESTGIGYNITGQNKRIHHLLYMDDLKLFAKDDKGLDRLLQITKSFSSDICMEFGLNKCAKVRFHRGKLATSENMNSETFQRVKSLDASETYKYLGFEECLGTNNRTVKERLEKVYIKRLRSALDNELCAKFKIETINTIAVPVLRYSFGIVNWSKYEMQALDRKTRKLLRKFNLHHPAADIDRLYVSRLEGGRGLIQLESLLKSSVIATANYLKSDSGDPLKQMLADWDRNQAPSLSLQRKAEQFQQELYRISEDVENTTVGRSDIREILKKPKVNPGKRNLCMANTREK